jgi:glutamate dehydrogenase/leucine dehydrogenase
MTEVLPLSLQADVDGFAGALVAAGTRRAFFVLSEDGKELVASDPALAPLAAAIQADSNFDDHEAAFFEVGPESGALLGAFLHKTARGQGAGGVRHRRYDTLLDFVQDGLRLSRGMGRKNALAGLFWGGGKGVIGRLGGAIAGDPAYRKTVYEEYGRFITSLRGAYVTAEDVGTDPGDMASIFRTTRFVTCIPPSVGGSGNPATWTARGVVCAMEAAVAHRGQGTLQGKTVAMQGTGNVGAAMIGDLLERGVARVVATDVSPERGAALAAQFAGGRVVVRTVAPSDTTIFEEPADIFAPNALGAILNPDTIPRLRARIVCGAANNQLKDEGRDDRALYDRGILYVPDFVANRMGIVNCANEQYGSLPEDPAILRHLGREYVDSVFLTVQRILERSQKEGVTTSVAANTLADAAARTPHPLFPGRTRAIVRALVRERWQAGLGGG